MYMESGVKVGNLFLVCEVDHEYLFPKEVFSYAKRGLYELIRSGWDLTARVQLPGGEEGGPGARRQHLTCAHRGLQSRWSCGNVAD